MEILRFSIAALLFVLGLFILGVATLGFFRLKSPLNRLHAAAKCDTMGALLVLSALAIISGPGFTLLKIFMLIVFFWITNPMAVYMIGQAEVQTNPNLEQECEVIEL